MIANATDNSTTLTRYRFQFRPNNDFNSDRIILQGVWIWNVWKESRGSIHSDRIKKIYQSQKSKIKWFLIFTKM